MNINEIIMQISEEVVRIRHELHQYPELSKQEFMTKNRISQYLSSWDIDHVAGIAETGLVGIIKGNETGKTIGLRADMDGLPIQEMTDLPFKSKNNGVMHGCGHDFHMAILLGAAKVFKKIEKELPGNIKLIFQPAEEAYGGAERMIQEGVLENPYVDHVIGLHVMSHLPVGALEIKSGKLNGASSVFQLKIIGKSGHSASPEKAIDPILVMSHVIVGLQSIVSRSISPFDTVALSFGKIRGGEKSNIIPEEVIVTGTLRCLNTETRAFVKQKMIQIVEKTAETYGAKGEALFGDGYIALTNDEHVVKEIIDVAKNCTYTNTILSKEKPSLGGEDFSYFAKERPSAFYYIGCGFKERENPDQHNNKFMGSDDCIPMGIELQVKSALKLMTQQKS